MNTFFVNNVNEKNDEKVKLINMKLVILFFRTSVNRECLMLTLHKLIIHKYFYFQVLSGDLQHVNLFNNCETFHLNYNIIITSHLRANHETVSDWSDFVHGAATLLNNHIGELCHLDFSVISLFHQVHHGQRRTLHHCTGPLPVSIVTAFGLLASSSASEGLVPGRLDDPVLSPGQLTEIDEMLLPATLAAVWAGVTVPLRSVGMEMKDFSLGIYD